MGGNLTIEERVASLEARTCAHDAALKREREVSEAALKLEHEVLTQRFDAANKIKEAMLDRERSFVTVGEFRWAVGSVILVLLGIVLKLVAA